MKIVYSNALIPSNLEIFSPRTGMKLNIMHMLRTCCEPESVASYAMLMRPKKAETAVHGC